MERPPDPRLQTGLQRVLVVDGDGAHRSALVGDRLAFRALVLDNSQAMFRLAWRLAGEQEAADDIVQEAFLAEGAKVVVNGRDEAKGQQCLAEMGAGDNAAFFAGDASKQDAVEGLIDFTIERYGQLDICCLNSGGVNMTAPVAQMNDEEWQPIPGSIEAIAALTAAGFTLAVASNQSGIARGLFDQHGEQDDAHAHVAGLDDPGVA